MVSIYHGGHSPGIQGAVSQKILRLRFTLRTSSSSWRNTTSAILCQQTIGTTSFSHSEGLVTFENSRNHKIIFFMKRIFALDIYLRLRSLLRFFVKRGPGKSQGKNVLMEKSGKNSWKTVRVRGKWNLFFKCLRKCWHHEFYFHILPKVKSYQCYFLLYCW